MPRYLNSTHQKNWIFTQTGLDKIYENKQTQLLQIISNVTSDPNLQRYVLTQSEESAVVHFLSKNLITCCRHLHVHDKAVSTALAYYKRFYLYNSVCEYDPVQMMFTSMFLACKTEEINIRDVHHFCQQFKESDPNALLQLEFFLISGIKFQLYVFCPYKPLRVLLEFISVDLVNREAKGEIEEKTKEIIETCLISDIALKYSPSEIAVSSLYIALESHENKAEIFAEVFELINKDFNGSLARIQQLSADYSNFRLESEKIEGLFRGALKKAGSLRHRIKKLQKAEEPTKK